MDQSYTLGLSLFDFVPPLAFLVGAVFLVRLADQACGRTCKALVGVGTGLVFLGGTLKAIWKLLSNS